MSYVRSKRYPELFRKHETGPWWAFLPNREGGKQPRESTKLKDERAAHEWYLERVRGPNPAKDQKERTLVDALDDRIDWLKAGRLHDDPTRKKLSIKTIEFYVKKSRQVSRVLGKHTLLSAIGHEQIRKYIVIRTKETAKGTTIAKELTALSCAMRLARKDGVACAHFRDIVPEDFKALYVPKKRWLPEAEVDKLLAKLEPKRAAVVAFIVATGATYPSEVAPFRIEHVNRKTYEVHILGTKRSSRNRHLRVPSHARKYLDFALKHLGLSGFEKWGNIRRDLHVAATAAKIAALSPNDLRRTFAQWLVRSGVPHELTYPMMGHSSPKMLETVYGRRDATAVADLVELALKRAPRGARKAG